MKTNRKLIEDITGYGSVGKSLFFGTKDIVRAEMLLGEVMAYYNLPEADQLSIENRSNFMNAVSALLTPFKKICNTNPEEEPSLFLDLPEPQEDSSFNQ